MRKRQVARVVAATAAVFAFGASAGTAAWATAPGLPLEEATVSEVGTPKAIPVDDPAPGTTGSAKLLPCLIKTLSGGTAQVCT